MAANITSLQFRLSAARSKYEQGRGQLALLCAQREDKQSRLDGCKHSLNIWRQVQVLLTKTSEYARQQLTARIEETVTAALRAVISEDLSFRIVLSERGGQPTADWEVVSYYGQTEIANSPEDSRGGGIVDIVSIALRLAMLELSRPQLGGPLILDEPGKMISSEYAPNLALFLKKYARRTGRQVIMITHNAALAEVGDMSYRVTKNAEGMSEVSEI